MADNRIAYGLAKKYGIDTDGMSPKEVWEALAKKGVKELGGHKDEVYYKSAEELKEQQKIELALNTRSVETDSKKVVQFDNGLAANQYFRDVEEKWLKSLDDDTKKILNDYTNELYYSLNAYLRGNLSNYDHNKGEIEKIDSAIDKFVLKDPITVYRAVTSSKELAGTTLKKGDQINWKTYTSTSMDKNAVNGEQYMLYEIEVPRGKGRGAYINSLSEYKDIEYEFLLKRDTTAEVTDVIEEKGKKIIKLKVIENE